MSAEYTNNHYVPQWYQRNFIPAATGDRELFLLDLHPEWFKDGNGKKRRRKAVRRLGTRKCFAIDDLYTTRLGGIESRELERVFFGEIDARGKRAVEYFAAFAHDGADGEAVQDLMRFMSTQKLRTPKGLDWLVARAGASERGDVLRHLVQLQTLYGAIWTECAWQIVDASQSATKFIVSDHPVTVYNHACAPGNPLWSKGANDPDIRLHATHTVFPLTSERLLILTNVSWACNPMRPPLQTRGNPDLYRGAMFNFLDIQLGRRLSRDEVLKINWIIKQRAYRYVAAGREEWLYPEREIKFSWRQAGEEYLLMPDPRDLHPGSEIIVGYEGGATDAMDSLGRLPGDRDFGREARSGEEIYAHQQWRDEFERIFGKQRRGQSWRSKTRSPAP